MSHQRALRAHPNRPKLWVTARYFGAFHRVRRDRWVFGDRDSGRYLAKFSWTSIVRHRLVTGGAAPDDPDLASTNHASSKKGGQSRRSRSRCAPGHPGHHHATATAGQTDTAPEPGGVG